MEPDLLRSLAICMMVLYHVVFDLSFFYGYGVDPLGTGWWLFARTTAILFLLLVGFSFELSKADSRKRWKRTGVIALCALAITAATYLWDPTIYIQFGILHCIAASLLLLPLLPTHTLARLILAVTAVVMGNLMLSTTGATPWLLPLGVRPVGFTTLDYFPFLPWFGVVVLGTLLPNITQPLLHTYPEAPGLLLRAATLPGRHALPLYMLHQPLIVWILSIAL